MSARAEWRYDAIPAVTFSGFGTVGVTRSSSRHADFVSDLSQPDGSHGQWTGNVDSRVGVQADIELAPTTRAVVQAVSRYRYDGSWDPEITWAFLQWEATPQISARVGRLGTEFFMLADSRLVGYSYLTVLPPVDYFSVLPINYIDGVDVAYTVPVQGGILRTKAYGGYAAEKIRVVGETWRFAGSPMIGVSLEYQLGPWQTRIGYTDIRFAREMPAGPLFNALNYAGFESISSEIALKNRANKLYSVGVLYDQGPVKAQLMLGYTKHDTAALENTHNGYFQFGYRTGDVTPYVGTSWIYSTKRDHFAAVAGIPVIATNLNALIDDAHNDQHTFFIGARWEATQNLAVKAQLDVLRGHPDSRFTVREDTGKPWTGRSNILSITADFVF